MSLLERWSWFCCFAVFTISFVVGAYVLSVMAWEFTRRMLGYVVLCP